MTWGRYRGVIDVNRVSGLLLTLGLVLLLAAAAQAQEGQLIEKVERLSPNHTRIVIHDTRPDAVQRRRDLAQRAQARLDAQRAASSSQPQQPQPQTRPVYVETYIPGQQQVQTKAAPHAVATRDPAWGPYPRPDPDFFDRSMGYYNGGFSPIYPAYDLYPAYSSYPIYPAYRSGCSPRVSHYRGRGRSGHSGYRGSSGHHRGARDLRGGGGRGPR